MPTELNPSDGRAVLVKDSLDDVVAKLAAGDGLVELQPYTEAAVPRHGYDADGRRERLVVAREHIVSLSDQP